MADVEQKPTASEREQARLKSESAARTPPAKVRIVSAENGADTLAAAEERAVAASLKAAQARQDARDAQRLAADSVQRSAESQEQTAQAYEEAARRTGRDDYLERAARRRRDAQQDRLITEKLRQMADADLTDSTVASPP